MGVPSKPDIPTGVVLSEAVELASIYCGERSAPFLNGVSTVSPARSVADEVTLRPWRADDTPALVAAWHDDASGWLDTATRSLGGRRRGGSKAATFANSACSPSIG